MTSVTKGPAKIEYGAAPRGLVLAAILVVSSCAIFYFGARDLVTVWMTPEYSHGWLIPVISAYLFLKDLRDTGAENLHSKRKNAAIGYAVLSLGLVLATLGNVARIPDIVNYGLIVWLSGLSLVYFGWQRGRAVQLSVFHLVFMLPLPQFLYWKLNVLLQGISSEVGVWFIMLFDIPVFLDGHIIDLGTFQLLVAEACSGLRYLFPILSFSYLFAILYNGERAHKLILVASAVPIAVLMNSFRIGVIGILVNSYGIGHAEGFLHYFEGWVIFIFCIAILFVLSYLLKLASSRENRKGDGIGVDLDFEGLLPAARALKPMSEKTVLALTILSLISLISIQFIKTEQVTAIPRDSFNTFPSSIEDWRGTRSYLEPEIELALGADDYLNINLRNTESNQVGTTVNLFVAFYEQQIEGSGIHSPEVCLPSGGWEIYSLIETDVDIDHPQYPNFKANRAIIQK
jgi:exosortase D (VPLPA-CTERM-specific)